MCNGPFWIAAAPEANGVISSCKVSNVTDARDDRSCCCCCWRSFLNRLHFYCRKHENKKVHSHPPLLFSLLKNLSLLYNTPNIHGNLDLWSIQWLVGYIAKPPPPPTGLHDVVVEGHRRHALVSAELIDKTARSRVVEQNLAWGGGGVKIENFWNKKAQNQHYWLTIHKGW